jgi:hypothetical protein
MLIYGRHIDRRTVTRQFDAPQIRFALFAKTMQQVMLDATLRSYKMAKFTATAMMSKSN